MLIKEYPQCQPDMESPMKLVVKPLEVEDLEGLCGLRSLGALVKYSPKGCDLLPLCCDLVWDLILCVSYYVEVTGCTQELNS